MDSENGDGKESISEGERKGKIGWDGKRLDLVVEDEWKRRVNRVERQIESDCTDL